jgi:RNA polymerase sigma factor (sigma-70 family)
VTRARRNQLIIDNMPLVRRIARQCARHFSPRLPLEDFVQDGYVGLCDAARRCSNASTFPQFAYFRIRGAMVDARRRKAYREELNPSIDGPSLVAYLQRKDTAAPPDLVAGRLEMDAFARDAIAELPEDERFIMRESLHGIPLSAIAAECERSAAWTRGKLAVARLKVVAAVQERVA